MILYGSRLSGRIVSMGFFGSCYFYFKNSYFMFLSMVVFVTVIVAIYSPEAPASKNENVERKASLKDNIALSFKTIKQNRLGLLIFANSIILMSPAIEVGLKYFLIKVCGFINTDFALRSLFSELCLFLGIILMGTVFKNIKRSIFLKISFTIYSLWTLALIAIVNYHTEIALSPLVLMLIFTGVHSLLAEIKAVPVVGIFLEKCPPGLDAFFISLIFFFNNLSRNISSAFGSLFIYLFHISSTDFSKLDKLIYIHIMFSIAGCIILMMSHIPDKEKVKSNASENLELSAKLDPRGSQNHIPAIEAMGEEEDMQDQSLHEQTLFKNVPPS